jgi:hypothetical protein
MTQKSRDDIAILQARVEYLQIVVIDLLSRLTQDSLVEVSTELGLHLAQGQSAAEGSTQPDAYLQERKSFPVSLIAAAERKRQARPAPPRQSKT